MPIRNHIRTFLHLPTRLAHTASRITAAQRNLPSKLGSWTCVCGHVNSVYHLPSHAHPLGILACTRCTSTWHPGTCPFVPSPAALLKVNVLLPTRHAAGSSPEQGWERCLLPSPRRSGGAVGYGYVCLSEQCGLSWSTEAKNEWWGRSRVVLSVGGRRWKGSCLCGRKICVGGGFAVFEVVPKGGVGGEGE
ncbi:uncharacterized protein EKO05_0007988 [Ascochyta rabiei]|uniref:Uncharacterized protein n=1 Tax=Didymella rabiei TaxID=5454 RepID=A0A163B866_DIDRA|nr:uncharacterized protein EKO05_0007988 [Ascochyta rabiei]KZM21618.1 hypothetical protein ST47_g7262 [Ascochyta rabiei]UPX17647.1 hypothetical protein EKO05_0007988 [Ascochyta rabiei]